jgi:hypothetical protein
VRQLEAGDEAAATPCDIADPGLPALPEPADTIAGLIAARDAERARSRRQDNDIGLLVGSNKTLRRELHALRVRRWRDEETIQALEGELAQTERAHQAFEAQLAQTRPLREHDAETIQALAAELAEARQARARAARRGRQLADEVATLRSRPWHLVTGWLRSRPSAGQTKVGRRSILPGEGPFFDRGIRIGGAGAIVGATVRRIKGAPSGMLTFGPYLKLAAGTYAATIEARLYQRLPLMAKFKLEIVCDDARQLIGWRNFRLHSTARWQRFELIFAVWDGEDCADFETRIWAREGTPLEIGRMDLYQLTEEPTTADANAADLTGGAA